MCRTSLFHRRLDANRYRYLAFARHGRRSQIDMPRGRRNETAHEKQQRICRQAYSCLNFTYRLNGRQLPCARSTGPREGLYPVVCGKIRACHAREKSAKPLLAISLLEKGGVLGGLGICRGLPFCDSGSAGKNRDLATRPWFYASATCSFVRKNRVVVGGCLFFPALSKYGHSGSDPGAL